MRIEHDCLGTMELDDSLDYGIQTERARQNFPISGQLIYNYPDFICMLLQIKKSAARANASIGALDQTIADAISTTCDKIAKESFRDRFPQDIFQGGGGTSINMNVNEVIALLSNKMLTGKKGYDRVHPNTHVNMGQSTNDVIPSALHLSFIPLLDRLDSALARFEKTLDEKVINYAKMVKIGRTCLQDALPMTLGQEFSGYASFTKRMRAQIQPLKANTCYLTMGGTAIGTGLSTLEGYSDAFYAFLSQDLKMEIKPTENLFDGMQNGDLYIDISGFIKKIAANLSKMATDMRLLSSGPRAGFNELILPAVQPGSSIMPGKINPVIPEMVNQVAYQIMGNDVVINMAVEGGELDLNIWESVILKNITESFLIITNAIEVFRFRCIEGLIVNEKRLRTYAEQSLALSTVIATLFNYEKGVQIAEYAYEHNISVKEACITTSLLTEEQANELLDPLAMTNNTSFHAILNKYKFLKEALK